MLGWFVATHLTGVSMDEQQAVLAEMRLHPRPVTPRSLGELLCLTSEQRERYKFWQAQACDVVDPAEAVRTRDRERKALKRRKDGIPERGSKIAEAMRLEPNTPPKTLYDRMKHGRKGRKRPDGGPCEVRI
jgi:hypothetical protein